MPELFSISVADMLAELQRERTMRVRVYGNQIAQKMLKQEVADRRIAIIDAIIERLKSPLLQPVEAVHGKVPIVLYFGSREDADEFVASVKGAFSRPVEIKIP